jgi:hypothetical protein
MPIRPVPRFRQRENHAKLSSDKHDGKNASEPATERESAKS